MNALFVFILCICCALVVYITRIIEWHKSTKMVSHITLQCRC